MDYENKTIIGLTEKVILKGKNGKSRTLIARVDTGATKSSVDKKLAKELDLGPVIGQRLVKSASGNHTRPIIPVNVVFAGKRFTCDFSMTDRRHMKYPVLLGQNALDKGFLIDPDKK